MAMPKYLEVKQLANKEADMFIDGEIVTDEWYDDETSASGFRDALKELGDVNTINLHINSPGGSVFEGIAIYNMLKMHKAKVNVYVDGLAASIASVIAMSGDAIFMPSNSMLMIHNPWTWAQGNAQELRKQADDLDKICEASKQTYLDKAGDKLDPDTLQELLNAETWLTAKEAYDYGLADEVVSANKAVASLSDKYKERYHNVPMALVSEEPEEEQTPDNEPAEPVEETEGEESKLREQIAKQAKAEAEIVALQVNRMKGTI